MSKKDYPLGDHELLELIRHSSDSEAIREQIMKIEDINAPILDEKGYSTTYLHEAVGESNLTAVQVLLDNGADPNYSNCDLICDCALWELQYCDFSFDDPKNRIQIAKEFFLHGADPNLIPDGELESLYDYVLFKVFNDDDLTGAEWDYLDDFYTLLIAFGGGGKGYRKPDLSEPIDKDRIDDYRIEYELCDDNYHIKGYVVNPEGDRIGEV